jgi:hypothetical protein
MSFSKNCEVLRTCEKGKDHTCIGCNVYEAEIKGCFKDVHTCFVLRKVGKCSNCPVNHMEK